MFRWLLFGLLSAAIGLIAQTSSVSAPRPGQPGKDVLWLPSPPSIVARMLDLAKVTSEDVVIDLGSGDGRLVIDAARRGARAVGIEYNADLVALSERNAAAQGVSGRTTFIRADLFQADLSRATVVTLFLRDDLNLKLRPRLLDMMPGTRVVSNTFTMGDWEPDDTATVERGCANWCVALMWIVPAKVSGTWKVPQGELTLSQRFQMVTGTLRTGGNSLQVTGGRLRGNQITFTAGNTRYTGQVVGRTMDVRASNGSR